MTNLKRFFGLAAALVLALTVGVDAAQAQTTRSCSPDRNLTRVRSEGITELIGTITIRCQEGTMLGADGARMILRFSDGVQVTNTISSEENKIAKDITMLLNNSNATGEIGDPFAVSDGFEDRYTSGIDDSDRTVNGMVSDSNTVEFFYDRPSTGASAPNPVRYAIFRISGIRINASAADGEDIEVSIRSTGRGINMRETMIAASPRAGLVTKRVGNAISGLVCTASAKANAAAVRDNTDANIAKLEVKEGFNGAFKADELLGVGDDDQDGTGTRIMLSFADVPSGVNVYLRPGDANNDGTMDETNGLRCDEDAGGDSGGMLALQLLSGRDSNTGATADNNNYVKVDLSGGAGSAVYRVTAADDARTENCDIPIFYQRAAGAADVGTGTVSASFAPVSTSYDALVAASQVPRFVMTGSAMNMITISECSTTLLFPFVTNQANFDTGIVIANTSMDPMDTSESNGTCEIHYYGMMGDGEAAPSPQTSDMVEAGGLLRFQVSAEAAGFQGYLMAECDFQFAHGLAYVTNNFGVTPTVAHGYMALVVPMTRASAGDVESLGY